MSIEYIEQLINNLRTYQEQVETRTTEADHLRKQVEILRAALVTSGEKLEALQKDHDLAIEQSKVKDQEIQDLRTSLLEAQQQLTKERNRYGQLKDKSDTLQNKIDVIQSVFNGLAFEYYQRATAKAMGKQTE